MLLDHPIHIVYKLSSMHTINILCGQDGNLGDIKFYDKNFSVFEFNFFLVISVFSLPLYIYSFFQF